MCKDIALQPGVCDWAIRYADKLMDLKDNVRA